MLEYMVRSQKTGRKYVGKDLIMTSTRIHCPNCDKVAHEAYKKGYTDALKILEKELSAASVSRPIQIKIPADATLILNKTKEKLND